MGKNWQKVNEDGYKVRIVLYIYIYIYINVASDEGNSRNEIEHWPDDEVIVAVQS